MNTSSKTALVTGAGRGLGFGFVEKLCSDGYKVFAGVRQLHSGLPEMEGVTWVSMDIINDESIDRCFALISQQTGSLNLIVNNAGVNRKTLQGIQESDVSKLSMLKRESLLKMFGVNAVSPLLIVQKFLPLLKDDHSFIINISSCRASFHDEFGFDSANYGYRASKIALNMFTRGLTCDLPKNVKVFSVHPGSVKTEMNKDGTQDVLNQAESILNILQNWHDELNGQFLNYDGGLYPL